MTRVSSALYITHVTHAIDYHAQRRQYIEHWTTGPAVINPKLIMYRQITTKTYFN